MVARIVGLGGGTSFAADQISGLVGGPAPNSTKLSLSSKGGSEESGMLASGELNAHEALEEKDSFLQEDEEVVLGERRRVEPTELVRVAGSS